MLDSAAKHPNTMNTLKSSIVVFGNTMNKCRTEITQEQIEYYSRIERTIEFNAFESEEEENVFAQNVIKQVLDDGVLRVFSSKQTSKIIENLVQNLHLSSSVSQNLTEVVCEDFLTLSRDRCASHVVQAWLTHVLNPSCQIEWQREAQQSDGAQANIANNAMKALCKTVKNNVQLFLCDQYGSHVMRTLLQILSGVIVREQLNRSKYSYEYRKSMMHRGVEYNKGKQNIVQDVKPTSQLFLQSLKSLTHAILKLDDFAELLTHSNACPVIQTLLVAVIEKLPKNGLKLCQRIIDAAGIRSDHTSSVEEKDNVIPMLFVDPVSSHLMDILIEVCSAEVHQMIYNSCFRHHVMSFALHPVANYALQQLIGTSEAPQVAMILDELDLEKVLSCGHVGVVVKATEACKRCMPRQQAMMLNKLLKAFHTESHPQDCAVLFTSLVTREVYFKADDEDDSQQLLPAGKVQCNLHGTLMLQALLGYEDTKVITSSFLTIPTDQLLTISCDPSGNHVVDVFLASKNVTLKKKTKLINKFRGNFVQLSKEKYGSRVVDSCWKHSEVKHKQWIADELLTGEKELSENYYGKFVLRNCNIEYYKKKGCFGEGDYSSKEKVKKMFSDIVDTSVTMTTKPSKKRKSRNDASTSYSGEELNTTVKKKKLFEDESD